MHSKMSFRLISEPKREWFKLFNSFRVERHFYIIFTGFHPVLIKLRTSGLLSNKATNNTKQTYFDAIKSTIPLKRGLI